MEMSNVKLPLRTKFFETEFCGASRYKIISSTSPFKKLGTKMIKARIDIFDDLGSESIRKHRQKSGLVPRLDCVFLCAFYGRFFCPFSDFS